MTSLELNNWAKNHRFKTGGSKRYHKVAGKGKLNLLAPKLYPRFKRCEKYEMSVWLA